MSFETKASFTAAELTALLWNRIRPLVDVKNSSGVLLTPVEPPFTLCTVNSSGKKEIRATRSVSLFLSRCGSCWLFDL